MIRTSGVFGTPAPLVVAGGGVRAVVAYTDVQSIAAARRDNRPSGQGEVSRGSMARTSHRVASAAPAVNSNGAPLRPPTRSQADPLRQATTPVVRWQQGATSTSDDELVVEEPLELRLRIGETDAQPPATETLAIIM